MSTKIVSVAFLLLFARGIQCGSDRFDEELFIRPLASGHLYGHFQFTTTWDVDPADKHEFQHYHLFPKSLGEVLAKYSVQELHLSLTQGLWRHDIWDYSIYDAPPGAEIWVWFQEGTHNVDATWTELINVLSGMFCASLNFMDATATVAPKFSFRPQGVATDHYVRRQGHLLKYAALPRENVCTENLTPWKKLLPCSSKAGLGTLFNAIKLYDASYHSLGVHYKPVCQNSNCSEIGVELSQTLSVVFEPTLKSGKQDWSLKTLFGRSLGSSCPLATDSKMYVDASANKTLVYYMNLSPEPSRIEVLKKAGQKVKYAVYDIPEQVRLHKVLNVAATYNKEFTRRDIPGPMLTVHKFQTGHGQAKGGITCLIYNNHHEDFVVSYMEMVPWYLRTYLHTLDIQYFRTMAVGENGTQLKPTNMNYIPGRDRERCYLLELILRLPANSITQLSIQFERALLKWTEYPPDASHGFYVNSAIISTVLPSLGSSLYLPQSSSKISDVLHDNSSRFFLRVHTESLLVTLPTPDFSMPYNVICLACTVIAIAFGSIHNLTTRRFTVLDPNKKTQFQKIKDKIKSIFRGSKKEGSTDDKKEVASSAEADVKDSNSIPDSDESKKDQ